MKTKSLFITFIISILLGACSHKQSNKEDVVPVDPASQLRGRLEKVVQQGGFAVGHHDDTAYGHSWKYVPEGSDVKEVVGDYPALLSWDLGMIECNTHSNLDSVPFAFIREQVIDHASKGGVSTFSWHATNPVTGGDSWDVSAGDIIHQAVTPGNSLNGVLTQWIGTVADFFLSLDGTPVIFRPWHEHTGSWFWWGQGQCSKEDYVELWKMTRGIFDEKGVNNVLWAYSPDKENCNSLDDYMARYPGDEYVDIMGADVYHFGGADGVEQYSQWMNNTLGSAVEAAKEHGKIAALTETGSESLPMDNWFTEVLMPLIKDYPISYVCMWRNAHDKPMHYYMPFTEHPAAQDLVKFYNLPQTIFLQEMSDIK